MLIAIRLRSTAKAREQIEVTLNLLRLNKIHNAIVVNETPSMTGMLRKAKDYIAYGNISDDMLKKLILKRGRMEGNKRLDAKEAAVAFEKIKKGEFTIKPVFCLTPPSGGFKKSIKQHYPRGELGNRKEKINELIERMI